MTKQCSVDGCDREVEAKGLCSRHYYRQKRGGDITTKSMKEKSYTEKFWEKVKLSGLDDCWMWQATKDGNGYGMMKTNGRHERAHRVSHTLLKGTIPNGLFVCHTCDTPGCVNPAHLFLGTNDDNMKDMVAKGRSDKERRYCILSRDQAKAVYDVRYSVSATALAKEYNVSVPTVYAIWCQRNWKEFSAQEVTA
jgi:hypothetical protein